MSLTLKLHSSEFNKLVLWDAERIQVKEVHEFGMKGRYGNLKLDVDRRHPKGVLVETAVEEEQ